MESKVVQGGSYALAAGFCAATASSCAKLAMAGETTLRLCHSLTGSGSGLDQVVSCDGVVLFVRLGFFALVFVLNAIMWTLFVKALQGCTSSLQATVTNTASNFFFTAMEGWLLFGEVLNLMWWFGASLIVLGLFFLHRGSNQTASSILKEKTS